MKLSIEDMANFRNFANGGHGIPAAKRVLRHIEVLDQELIRSNQSNLMHQENERVLMGHRSDLHEKVGKLGKQVESLTTYSNRKVERIQRMSGDLCKAWAACNAERESRMLLEATLERAMLDHQPVVLPKDVVEAVIHYQKELFTADSFARMFFKHIECGDNEHTKTLKNYVIGSNVNGNKLLRALVNGYTVEVIEDPTVKELADMISKWVNTDTNETVDEECKQLANKIFDFVEGIKK